MRRLLLAAVAALLCFTISPQTRAQQQGRSPAPVAVAEPMVGRAATTRGAQFRQRSAQERLAAVQRILSEQQRRAPNLRAPVLNFTSGQLGESFALTPRSPYVINEGALSAFHSAFVDTWSSPSGEFYFSGEVNANAHVYIRRLDARRLLIECTVGSHNGPFDALLYGYGGQTIWTDTSTPFGGVVSFLTPPNSEYADLDQFLRIRPVAQNASWRLVGCEVTRMGQ